MQTGPSGSSRWAGLWPRLPERHLALRDTCEAMPPQGDSKEGLRWIKRGLLPRTIIAR